MPRTTHRTAPYASPSRSPFTRRDWLCVLAIFALALSLRLIAVYQARTLIFSQSLVSDGEAYDKWAQRIVAGDWLGKEVFYQAPLYPYFLAVVQLVAGHDYARIRIVQCAIGAISCVLLFLAGRRLLSRPVGLIAGLMLALYAPAIFFDTIIQKAVLDLLFMTLLLWLLAREIDAPTPAGMALAGMTLGLFALTRENALILAPVILIWTLVARRSTNPPAPPIRTHHASGGMTSATPPPPRFQPPPTALRSKLARSAAFLAGLFLILLPVGLRNLYIGGEFALTTSQAGPNFYIGNHAGAPGTYVPLIPDRMSPEIERRDATDLAEKAVGRKLTPGEVSSYWFGQSWAYISGHPGDWLALLGRKLLMTVNSYEIQDAEDYYYYKNYSHILFMTGFIGHVGVLFSLAAAGFVLAWPLRRRLALPLALLLALIAAVALFYVFARYRYPIVPILILFASAGLVEIPCLLRRGIRAGPAEPRPSGSAPLQESHPSEPRPEGSGRTGQLARGARETAPPATQSKIQNPKSKIAPVVGTPGTAKFHFALAAATAIVAALLSNLPIFPHDPTFYVSHVNAGYAYAKIGRLHDAIAEYRTALAARSDSWGLHHHLGQLLVQTGQPDAAIDALTAAAKLNPDIERVWMWLGFAYADKGDNPAAVEHLQRALSINPDEAETLNRLGSLKTLLGKWPEGIADMRRSLALIPDHPGFKLNLAWALATAPDTEIESAAAGSVLSTHNATPPATAAAALFASTSHPSPDGWGRRTVESQPAPASAATIAARTSLRSPAEAVELAERAAMAMTLSGGPIRDPRVFDIVAAAYASAGRFDHAVKTLKKGLELIPPTDTSPFAQDLRSRLALYHAGRPFHQPPLP